MSAPPLAKSSFVNIDARARCLTPDCWGDLVLMPTGEQDRDGVPAFLPFTACPLCSSTFPIEQDMTDRELFLKVSWLRANPHVEEDEAPPEGAR